MQETAGTKQNIQIALLCAMLLAAVFVTYIQVGGHQFLNLDDDVYVTNNPHVARGLTSSSIVYAITSFDAGNWHPLTWLSHMADVQLFGMNPRGHHLVNVAIHAATALLIFVFFARLTGAVWQSYFVATMFAFHPLHVESVAWVAERKDVLSAFFWFLTMLMYLRYVETRKPFLYLLSLLFFVLGLMTKPMLVTLPAVLLLMDYWPLERNKNYHAQGFGQYSVRVISLINEKIPFLLCSFLSGIITLYAQHKAGAVAGLDLVSFPLRLENAIISYVTYIGKTVWPHDLALLYPFPAFIPIWKVMGALFILFLLSMAAICVRQRAPYVTVGWFWFIITLVPVIGLVQVGAQSMADRYSYLPLTGLFITAAWGTADLTKGMRYRLSIVVLLASVATVSSIALTWRQLGYWRENFSIYRHTLAVTTSNHIIHNNLGAALYSEGNLNAAIQEYRKALGVRFSDTRAHNNLGLALVARGDLDAAILEYREALRVKPSYVEAHNNLGSALARKGNLAEAVSEFRKALDLDANYAEAHFNLGLAFVYSGDLNAAVDEYRKALQVKPDYVDAQHNLRVIVERRVELR